MLLKYESCACGNCTGEQDEVDPIFNLNAGFAAQSIAYDQGSGQDQSKKNQTRRQRQWPYLNRVDHYLVFMFRVGFLNAVHQHAIV